MNIFLKISYNFGLLFETIPENLLQLLHAAKAVNVEGYGAQRRFEPNVEPLVIEILPTIEQEPAILTALHESNETLATARNDIWVLQNELKMLKARFQVE